MEWPQPFLKEAAVLLPVRREGQPLPAEDIADITYFIARELYYRAQGQPEKIQTACYGIPNADVFDKLRGVEPGLSMMSLNFQPLIWHVMAYCREHTQAVFDDIYLAEMRHIEEASGAIDLQPAPSRWRQIAGAGRRALTSLFS
jgi:hypothetical protein